MQLVSPVQVLSHLETDQSRFPVVVWWRLTAGMMMLWWRNATSSDLLNLTTSCIYHCVCSRKQLQHKLTTCSYKSIIKTRVGLWLTVIGRRVWGSQTSPSSWTPVIISTTALWCRGSRQAVTHSFNTCDWWKKTNLLKLNKWNSVQACRGFVPTFHSCVLVLNLC